MATRYDLEILIRTKKTGDGIPKADKEVENFGKRLNSTLKIIEASAGAAVAAGAVFKKAFDLGEQGANLIQLRDSFNALNESTLKTPGLLEDMQAAARGTIKDTDLMAGVLKLAAGTSGEYAQTLANVSPQLIEIAKASNKLNPALGSTQFLYESLTTAAKRQSVPIADNLGLIIKMEDATKKVHPALQNLATDYNDLTKQQQFLNELLFQGDTLIDQVGGSVDSQADSWARLTVQVQEETDAFKEYLARGLGPVVSALAGDYGDAVIATTEATLKQTDSLDELVQKLSDANSSYDLSRTLLGRMTGTSDDVAEATRRIATKTAESTDNYDEFADALAGAGINVGKLRSILAETGAVSDDVNISAEEAIRIFYEYAKSAQLTRQEFEDLAPAIEAASGADRKFTQSAELAAAKLERQAEAFRDVNRILGMHSPIVEKDTREIEDMAYATGELGDAQDRLKGYIEADTKALREQADAHEELISRTRAAIEGAASISAIDDLFQAQSDLAAASGEWVTGYRNNTTEIADISRQLSMDLSDDQEDAYRDILGTVEEGGTEWLNAYNALQGDLSDSQREALVARQAELSNAHGEAVSYFTGDAAAAEDAQKRIDAAYAAVSANYRQVAAEIALAKISEAFAGDAVAAQTAYLQTQVALGNLSQDQADFLLGVTTKSEAVKSVTSTMFDKFLEDGVLTEEESGKIAAAVALIEQSGTDSETAMRVLAENGITNLEDLGGEAKTATDHIFDMKEQIGETADAIDRLEDKTVTVKFVTDTSEYSPPVGIPGNTQVPMPGGPPGAATNLATGTGGQFVSVPQGFPGDSYPIALSTGEDYMVRTPRDRAAGVGMGGGGLIVQNYINTTDRVPDAARNATKRALMQSFRQGVS